MINWKWLSSICKTCTQNTENNDSVLYELSRPLCMLKTTTINKILLIICKVEICYTGKMDQKLPQPFSLVVSE